MQAKFRVCLLIFLVLGIAPSRTSSNQAPSGSLIPVSRDKLCVTEGALQELKDSRVVSIKRNPGMLSSSECGNRGYQNIKPKRWAAIPSLRRGDSHSLLAQMNGSEMRVFVDGGLEEVDGRTLEALSEERDTLIIGLLELLSHRGKVEPVAASGQTADD